MRIIILFALIFLSFSSAYNTRSPGCGRSLPDGLTPGGPSRNLTLESKSQIGTTGTRSFLTYLPHRFSSENNKAAPLILAFHGQTQPAWSMESITKLSTPHFNEDYVVVYPEGLNYKSPGQQWLGDPEAPPSSIVDDRIFVTELLDHLTSTLCIDESRIYATGLSNGGGLTGLLACTPALNRRIAAFAGVAAAFYTDQSLTEPLFGAGCEPELEYGRRIPIMEMHGLNDSVIAYDGNNSPAPDTIPLSEWVGAWVKREGCEGKEPRIDILDGGNVTRSSWGCGGWRDVFVHYRIDKFGHGWPSTEWYVYDFLSKIDPTSSVRATLTYSS
ncbi:hypothetical protein N0V90_010524 [Kalmusia sp. IMI 367209]|nr:hypothetical protein N0V90_010524 [Kalmusia sp. IMI 367209]